MLRDTKIPSVSEKPVKSLGKLFIGNLKDTAAQQGTSDDLNTWLSAVDKSGLPGKFKAWIYQHGILLVSSGSQSGRGIQGHPNQVLLYQDSADIKVSSAGVEVPFAAARDWQLLVNLGRQLRFLDTTAATSLLPDMVLMSAASKLLEITVPWEDQVEEAQERKRVENADLVPQCQRNGWKARSEPIEVACRVFAGQSLQRVLGLEICGLHRRRAIKKHPKGY